VETIEVWRGQFTTDTDGNPIQGKPARVGTFQAMVAPTSTTDPTEETASPQPIRHPSHRPDQSQRHPPARQRKTASVEQPPRTPHRRRHHRGRTGRISMAKRCRFVFNRKAFSQQVLKNETLRSRMRDAAEAAVEDDRCMVRDHDGKNRSGVAIICPAPVEKAHGTLEDTLGRMRV